MKNIVWLASYPKSGNTWFRMFLSNYLHDKNEPAKLEEIERPSISSSPTEFEGETGLNPFELYADEVDLYRPGVYRVLSETCSGPAGLIFKKAHDAFTLNRDGVPLFPKEVSRSAVYFVRNPLDVCVSYANHAYDELGNSIDFILNEKAELAGNRSGQLRQVLMSWSGHVQSWLNQDEIPVHFVRYEDMLNDASASFEAIVRFTGLDYDENKLNRALVNCDFRMLRQMEDEGGFREKFQQCRSFFWKGKAGYYRDFLNDDQIKRIVDYNHDTMLRFGYIDINGNLTI